MAVTEARVAHVNSIPLAVIRRQVRQDQLASAVPEGCGTVWEFVRARNLKAGRNVALYRDGTIRLEVGVEVPDSFEDTPDVVRSATPAGPAATITHFGPYQQLGTAHKAILNWCTARGLELAGPSWEIYGHWQNEWNADPSQIRTDVFYLLVSDLPGA